MGVNLVFFLNFFAASKEESPQSPDMNRNEPDYEHNKHISYGFKYFLHDLLSCFLFGVICIATELCFVSVSYLGAGCEKSWKLQLFHFIFV